MMKVGINTNIIGKLNNSPADNHAWTHGWTNHDMSPKDLQTSISKGYGFGPQFTAGHRKASNFIQTQVLAVDIDKGWSIADLAQNNLVLNYAAFIYTTPSHTPDNPRLRVVFELTEPICDGGKAKEALTALINFFGSDQACKAEAQCFFGSPNCQFIESGKQLPSSVLDLLIAEHFSPKAQSAIAVSSSVGRAGSVATVSDLWLRKNQTVWLPNGSCVALETLQELDSCKCPFHLDKKPSAFVVKSSFGHLGLHCMACARTFWPRRPETSSSVDPSATFWHRHVFLALDDMWSVSNPDCPANVPSTNEPSALTLIMQSFTRYTNDARRHLSVDVVPPDTEGLILIKSPKGTNKTGVIAKLVEKNSDSTDGQSVILVGHRVALLKELASRLDLTFYKVRQKGDTHASRLAITTNSLALQFDTQFNALPKYHTVVIDEVEQVVSGLFAESVDQKRLVIRNLLRFIKHAKRIVFADADLGACAYALMVAAGRQEELHSGTVVLNQYEKDLDPKLPWKSARGPELTLFKQRQHLIDDMLRSFDDGRHLFICLNSRREADITAQLLRDRALTARDKAKDILLVTGETRETQEVQTFLSDPKRRFFDYRAVVSTGTLGTGIDLSFDEGTEPVGVYGFFDSRITTHWEMDQHLARVRTPQFVRVWIARIKVRYETDPQALRHAIRYTDMQWAYAADLGDDEYDRVTLTHPVVDLYAAVEASRRFSMSDLRGNFSRLRELDGWTVKEVEAPSEPLDHIASLIQDAKLNDAESSALAILNAPKLTDDEAEEYLLKRRQNQPLTNIEQKALDRYFLCRFYAVDDLTRQIVDDDSEVRRAGIMRFEMLLADDKALLFSSRHADSSLLPKPHRRFEAKSLGIALLETCGLQGVLELDCPEWSVTSDDLRPFVNSVKALQPEQLGLLGLAPRNDLGTKPMLTLKLFLRRIGLDTCDKPKKRNVKLPNGGAKRAYVYSLDRAKAAATFSIVERRSRSSARQPQ